MILCFTAKEIIDYNASDDFRNAKPKDTENKRRLEEFANNLSEFDNQVLMCVIFNKL